MSNYELPCAYLLKIDPNTFSTLKICFLLEKKILLYFSRIDIMLTVTKNAVIIYVQNTCKKKRMNLDVGIRSPTN